MKKVNLLCYQNTAQILLAKDGSCPHLCQSEGSKQGPPFNSGFHLLIYGHMACGILFPQQMIEPGPSEGDRVLTIGPPGNSGTRVSYNSLQGLERDYKVLPPLRILG